MKKILVTTWLTILCFLLLGNVHAWDVPSYLRVSGSSRMWFTNLQGDLLQNDHTKLGLTENLGIKRDKLVWEFLANFRFDNIHVLRFRTEPFTVYEQSYNDSFQKIRTVSVGYDLDFYMTPQALFGLNFDVGWVDLDTRVRNVRAGGMLYNYQQTGSRVIPGIGAHGTFYPILTNVALRPNVSGRANWWSYESIEAWDAEFAWSVDVPVNRLWTWTVSSGYRVWHLKVKRERDTVDMNRTGFFVETGLLF